MMTLDREQALDDQDRKRPPTDAERAPGKQAPTDGLVGPNGPLPSGLDGDTTQLVQTAQASSASGLPSDLATELGDTVGQDVSSVRVHTGAESQQAASAMSADAFALGNDIHFAAGKFAPDTSAGRGLIAHEVAHVVQSGGDPGPLDQLALSAPSDAHETEAHAFGDAFAAGAPAPRPQARSQGVGRAIISRAPAGEDKPSTPIDPNAPTAGVGASAKVGTSGVAVAFTGNAAKSLKGASCEASVTITGTCSGTLTFPQIAGAPKVDVGGDAGAATDGKRSANGTGSGETPDLNVYKKTISERAGSETEQQDWLDGMEVVEVNLSASNSGSAGKADGKAAASGGIGLKVSAKLKNGKTVEGSVTIVSAKSEPPELSGPDLSLTVPLAAKEKTWNLGKGVDFKGSMSGTATVSIKPDWTALAKDAAKLVAETTVVAALDFAATMAISLAPMVAGASAASMVDDENELRQWTFQEARVARDAAISLWRGIQLGAPVGGSPRSAAACAQGKAQAMAAIASKGITQQEYIVGWKENPFMEGRMKEVYSAAQGAFDAGVRARAAAMYDASWSMKFWKSKGDVVNEFAGIASQAWGQKA